MAFFAPLTQNVDRAWHCGFLLRHVALPAAELGRNEAMCLNNHILRPKALSNFPFEAQSECNWLWIEPWQQYSDVQMYLRPPEITVRTLAFVLRDVAWA